MTSVDKDQTCPTAHHDRRSLSKSFRRKPESRNYWFALDTGFRRCDETHLKAVSVDPDHTMKQPCVYLLASRRNGTLYVGVTSDLVQRIWQHKNDLVKGFTRRYRVHTLVWYEVCLSMGAAIAREKAIKEWKRAWKIQLIESANPEWRDLYEELL